MGNKEGLGKNIQGEKEHCPRAPLRNSAQCLYQSTYALKPALGVPKLKTKGSGKMEDA